MWFSYKIISWPRCKPLGELSDSHCYLCVEWQGTFLIAYCLCLPGGDRCLVEWRKLMQWLSIAVAEWANVDSPQRRCVCKRVCCVFQYRWCKLYSPLNSQGIYLAYKHLIAFGEHWILTMCESYTWATV